jgi:hypothetical protein
LPLNGLQLVAEGLQSGAVLLDGELPDELVLVLAEVGFGGGLIDSSVSEHWAPRRGARTAPGAVPEGVPWRK